VAAPFQLAGFGAYTRRVRLLTECPDRSRGELRFRLFGVNVRVNFWFWIATLFLSRARDTGALLIWVAVCFVSILIHELGHVFAWRRYGVDAEVVLYSCGGLAIARREVRGTRARVMVSLAGPAAGFCVAALTLAAVWAAGGLVEFHWRMFLPVFSAVPAMTDSAVANPTAYYRTAVLLNDLLFVNFFWGLINLLPVYPLDGGQAARAILEQKNVYAGRRLSLKISATVATLVAMLGLSGGSLYIALMFGMLAISSVQSLGTSRAAIAPQPYRSTR